MQDRKPEAPVQARLHPIPAVGVVCWRGDEVLMIRRGRAPRQGQWSIPGGKINLNETLEKAALRELFEETAVTATLGPLLAVYEIIEPDFHYVLIDYGAKWIDGEPRADDDAAEARFMPLDEALSLVIQDDIRDVLMRSRP